VLLRASLRWHGTWDHTAPVRFVMHVFAALGETAADASVQRLAIIFQPFATLATSESIVFFQWASMLWALAMIGGLLVLTLRAEGIARVGHLKRERQRLADFRSGRTVSRAGQADDAIIDRRRPHGERLRHLPFWGGIGPLASRQLVTLRRYRAMVFVSLAIPGVLSLLPIWLGGFGTGTVLDVIGGLTFYTLLLAPPALKMDFRRDIEILLPLAALPLRPLAMVIGQIAVPVAVTILFQVIVVFIAMAGRPVSALQAVFWLTTLAGTAVFAFALENALFLAFPHRLKQEGIEMFIRTKLVFIGKGCLWAVATAVLVVWALFCARTFDQPVRLPVLAGGILVFVWSIALSTLGIAARAWRRFDLRSDLPA